METFRGRQNTFRSSSNMTQQTSKDQSFDNKRFGNQFEGNGRDQNLSLVNTNYGPHSKQQQTNMPRKSLLGLPPPKSSQGIHDSYNEDQMETNDNFDKQQSGWNNQEPFRGLQSRNSNENRNTNMNSNPVQNKDHMYGEGGIQPRYDEQNLGEGFEQVWKCKHF